MPHAQEENGPARAGPLGPALICRRCSGPAGPRRSCGAPRAAGRAARARAAASGGGAAGRCCAARWLRFAVVRLAGVRFAGALGRRALRGRALGGRALGGLLPGGATAVRAWPASAVAEPAARSICFSRVLADLRRRACWRPSQPAAASFLTSLVRSVEQLADALVHAHASTSGRARCRRRCASLRASCGDLLGASSRRRERASDVALQVACARCALSSEECWLTELRVDGVLRADARACCATTSCARCSSTTLDARGSCALLIYGQLATCDSFTRGRVVRLFHTAQFSARTAQARKPTPNRLSDYCPSSRCGRSR